MQIERFRDPNTDSGGTVGRTPDYQVANAMIVGSSWGTPDDGPETIKRWLDESCEPKVSD